MNYLFTIAIDNYQHFKKLNNAVRDAKEVSRILTSCYGFEIYKTLYEEKATRKNIINEFSNLSSYITQEDNLIIYFAGHGRMKEAFNSNKLGYWVCYESENQISDWISNSDIKDLISSIEAKHIFLIVDACFSGTFLTTTRGENPNLYHKKAESLNSRWYLSSGREETVSDGIPGNHSPFAYNLIYFLNHNKKQIFSVSELINDITQATNNQARQQAISGSIPDSGHEHGGEMIFYDNRYNQSNISSNADETGFIIKVQNEPPLNKIYESLKRFDAIPYLPKFFIINLYPFQSKGTYTINFNLVVDSIELFIFFSKIQISSDNKISYEDEEIKEIENYQKKLEYIVKRLNNALIYYLESYHHSLEEVKDYRKSIHLINRDSSNTLDSFRQFKFGQATKLLQSKNPKDSQEAMENAFTHYLFGNYLTAYELYNDLAQRFKNTDKIRYFICLYNFKKIGLSLLNLRYSTGLKKYEVLFNNTLQVDLASEFESLSLTSKQKELLSWIKDEKMLFQMIHDILMTAHEIITSYQSIKNGGFAMNNLIYQLRSKIAVLQVFYTNNCIIQEHFKEFKQTMTIATEAIIVAYAIGTMDNHRRSSSLDYFDDYFLTIITLYCKPDDLWKYLDEYDIEKIKYQSETNEFWDKLDNFFAYENGLSQITQNFDEDNTLVQRHGFLLKNLLIILAHLEMNEEIFEAKALEIINYLKHNSSFFHPLNFKYVNQFFYYKSDFFKSEVLGKVVFDFLKFIIFELKEESRNDEWLIRSLVNLLEDYHPQLKLEQKDEFKQLLELYAHKKVYLIRLYPILTEEFQLEIAKVIEQSLSDNFNLELCYDSIMQKILAAEKYLPLLIEKKNYKEVIKIKHHFNLTLSPEYSQTIKEASDKYDWLLEPANFDYSKFDFDWILSPNFNFSFYGKILKNIPSFVQLVQERIKEKNNEYLKKIYFEYLI